MRIQPQHPVLNYVRFANGPYAALHARNVPADFVSDEGELGTYKLVIAPMLFLDLPYVAERLVRYVEGAGTRS